MTHDKWHGCYRIGHPGALIPLPDGGTLEVARADSTVLSKSATGAVRALMPAAREPRTWAVEIPNTQPELIAPIMELLSDPSMWPPYMWVTPWSAITNLLSPEDSTLASLNLPRVGRMPLSEGGWSATGATNPYPVRVMQIGPAPVVSDRPMTATVRVASSSAVTLYVDQLDAAGVTVGTTSKVLAAPGMAALKPLSITLPAPRLDAVAVGMRVLNASIVARAQVTWTDSIAPFGIGEGCASVIVTGATQDAQHAVANADGALRSADFKFSVTEVG